MFLSYLHSFRAIASSVIVAGHCLLLLDWSQHREQERLIGSLLTNGTVFFVFVAGFLFQHLSHRFEYQHYLKRRMQYVILPYAILAIPTLAARAYTHTGAFNPDSAGHWPTAIQNAIWSLMTGTYLMAPFWFIPMIAILYLAAPLFLWIDRHERLYRLLPLLVLVMVFGHRATDNRIWQSVAYFVPAYLYGMWFSRHRIKVMAWHERWLPVLVAAVVGLVWIEVGILGRGGPIFSAALFSTEQGIIGTNALQKLLLCGVLLVLLQRYDSTVAPKLRYLGEVSFGVYFLHPYFIWGFRLLWPGGLRASLWLYGFSVVTVIALCLSSLWLAKRVLGRHSRNIVGC